MHHCNDMQQVILAQFLESVCQLFHINGLVAPAPLLVGGVFASDAVRISGARVLEESEELWLGVAEGLQASRQQYT